MKNLEPLFVFDKEDLLKAISKYVANDLIAEFDGLDLDKYALDVKYNDYDEIEVYLIGLGEMN